VKHITEMITEMSLIAAFKEVYTSGIKTTHLMFTRKPLELDPHPVHVTVSHEKDSPKIINLSKLHDTIQTQEAVINNLLNEVNELKERVIALEYAPGGPKYQEAKEDWTSKVKGEWKPIEQDGDIRDLLTCPECEDGHCNVCQCDDCKFYSN
jgi:hypothetical protein